MFTDGVKSAKDAVNKFGSGASTRNTSIESVSGLSVTPKLPFTAVVKNLLRTMGSPGSHLPLFKGGVALVVRAANGAVGSDFLCMLGCVVVVSGLGFTRIRKDSLHHGTTVTLYDGAIPTSSASSTRAAIVVVFELVCLRSYCTRE